MNFIIGSAPGRSWSLDKSACVVALSLGLIHSLTLAPQSTTPPGKLSVDFRNFSNLRQFLSLRETLRFLGVQAGQHAISVFPDLTPWAQPAAAGAGFFLSHWPSDGWRLSGTNCKHPFPPVRIPQRASSSRRIRAAVLYPTHTVSTTYPV